MAILTAQATAWQEALRQRLGVNSFAELRRFPRYFEIETIRACNSRCLMCTVNDWDNYGVRMSDRLFDKLLTEMAPHADWIQTVCLSRDGEPLLDQAIAARIAAMKGIGIRNVTMTTNAALLNQDKARELLASGLDDIMISIDGATAATFEKIRVGLNFATVTENIDRLIELRNQSGSSMSIRIRFVIMPENEHETGQWLTFWSARTAAGDRVYAMPMHTWGNQLPSAPAGELHTTPCVFLFSSLAIHADGRVAQCNVDYNSRHELGNVATETIKAVWSGPGIKELRDLHLSGRKPDIDLCRYCSLWDRTFVEAQP